MLLTRIRGRGGERPRGSEWSCEDGTKVVILLVLLVKGSLLFLLELHGAHAADSLFAFDALFFTCLKDLLVFYTEFATLYVKAVEGCDDCICICGLAEICESETSELTGLIEMIIESVRGWDRQRCLEKE